MRALPFAPASPSVVASLVVALLLALPGPASAVCPAGVSVLSTLTCSSTIVGNLNSGVSRLGGSCGSGACYSCGTPYSYLAQTGAEHVYSFTCQTNGLVNLDITGMNCDLDIYVLNSSCSPYSGCSGGSTAATTTADSVNFLCVAGQTYFVVIEGYGFTYSGAGACGSGNAGAYILNFDLSASTACNEDCADGIDNDFDGAIDCLDTDCANDPICFCDDDNDGYEPFSCGGLDCNDNNAAIYPGATELCNFVDDDCDGGVDEGFDGDGDGWTTCEGDCNDGDASISQSAPEIPYDGLDQDCDGSDLVDVDGDGAVGWPVGGPDCDDGDATVLPGTAEVCDGVDEDCDGLVDEGTVCFDDDGDGFTENGGDCDDGVPTVFPGAVEVCDGVDQDCDGTVDEGTGCFDDDGDGATEVGGDCNDADPATNPGATETMGNGIDDDCDGVVDAGGFDPDGDGTSEAGGDCAPFDPAIHPGAPEICDGVDEDCDGAIDEGTPCSDEDGDGVTEVDGDCHDDDASISPLAVETCDGIDQDCDGAVDEGTPCVDDDGDGFSEDGGDCDDGAALVSPAAIELLDNGVDDDCDGAVDETEDDLDTDGVTSEDGDCDDANPWAHPGLDEVCDGADNNCDGAVDEGCVPPDDDVDVEDPPNACGCRGALGAPIGATPGSLSLLAGLGLFGALRRRRTSGIPRQTALPRIALLLLVLIASGCSEGAIREVPRVLSVVPAVLDLGVVRPTESLPFTLRLDNLAAGNVIVASVELGEGADGIFTLLSSVEEVPRQASATLEFVFTPPEEGWFLTTVTVTSNADEPTTVAVVRGGGGEPSLRVVPGSLDFGPVPTGDTAARPVLLRNDGPAAAIIDSSTLDEPSFTLGTVLPLTVPASGSASLTLVFTAPDEEARLGILSLAVALGGALTVDLRANDCLGGESFRYDGDGDGVASCAGDCDDGDDAVRPGEPETADGRDEDCDGVIDEGTEAYDDDGDGFSENDGDCHDGDPWVGPGATELLDNGVDDDCDGVVDDATDDPDGDGYTVLGGDCGEGDPTVRPGAPELPDGLDNDCDGATDEGTTAYDDDGDGLTESQGDCDDTRAQTFPNAPETANGRDDDCDGVVDDGTYAFDDDGDGFAEFGGDCNDGDPTVHPAALEIVGNGVDDDCNGSAL